MSYNWAIITDKLYGIIKGSCDSMTMYNATGNETIDPKDATRFFASITSDEPDISNFAILVAIHDHGQTSFINIKTPDLKNNQDFEKVFRLRNHIKKAVGQREGIKIVWQVFDHAIDPREEAVHNIKESKDVSKWFGTTKSSFQKIGEAKLIIRHTDVVNEEKAGARTRHIRALFVENKLGERFSYPHLHMSGARAFARHISNGGKNHDSIAESILRLSSDYLSLRRAVHEMRRHSTSIDWVTAVRESMNGINKRLKSLHGPKGYSRASETLEDSAIVLDEHESVNIQQQLAENCGCDQEDPRYADFGVAANYITKMNQQPKDMEFKWSRRPDITAAKQQEVLERLHYQIRELADACANSALATRLHEIAEMIASNAKPSEDDLNFVREAFISSLNFVSEEETVIPEEIELENYLNDFTPEAIFSESDQVSQFIVGDKVKHKTQQLGIGTVVADPEGDEYPVKFGNDPEVYYTPAEDLELSETSESIDPADATEKDDNIIWCSNCGKRFHGNGRKHGFSHCENHKGFKVIYETPVTDDENVDEGWSIAKPIDTDRYQSRAGLEGPFMTKVGKVVYYDPKEGKYYDPDSDFYIDYDDYAAMNEESSVGSDSHDESAMLERIKNLAGI